MFSRMLAVALISIAATKTQLNPALVPRHAPKPALPRVVSKACPFEGCTFGTWRTRGVVRLFSTWRSNRKLLTTVKSGQSVIAVTGIYVTFAPAEIEVTAPIPQYGLMPGDVVLDYMELGEGVFNAWFKGFWVEDFDGSGVRWPHESGCSRNCNAIARTPGRSEWWVKIRTGDGVIGWTKDTSRFLGNDALGPPVR